MQRAVIRGHAIQFALEGLYFFKHGALGLKAIGPPAHHKVLVCSADCDFSLVAG